MLEAPNTKPRPQQAKTLLLQNWITKQQSLAWRASQAAKTGRSIFEAHKLSGVRTSYQLHRESHPDLGIQHSSGLMLHANILDADELWNLTDPKLQMPHPKDPESPEIQTLSALLSRQSLGQDDACRGEPRLRLSVCVCVGRTCVGMCLR